MPDDLEQELGGLHPIAPSSTLDAAVARTLQNSEFTTHHSEFSPRSLSDRLLLSTLSLAAAAALFIITLLTTDHFNNALASAPVASTTTPTLANAPRLLAQLTNESNAGILPAPQSTQPHYTTQ